ncbi:hypothetical protein DW025_10535 [Coprococcus sp. AF38-1]|jgi:hypothetical protein|uniref:hypothetical protein n=2 Tax=Coprococcus TaxID=33042 RepID=UPI000E762FB7|nr:hypothetical protein [Coprococcus sp. AF38-1]RJW74916.1 hypothetical protein DW025_10535 [Coprococcus sp. AF38-1]
MIRLEDVERRNSKIIQQRFGISAIYDTMEDNILNQEIYECTKKIDNIFPDCFIWYPRWHMTLIRCESVRFPFEVNSDENFYRQMVKELMVQPQIELRYTYSRIDSDGVIRCFFSETNWMELCAVKKFYMDKNLNYTIIENPWIALGNIKAEKFENVKRNIEDIRGIINEINISKICIGIVDFTYYEDVLLRKSQCIGKIKLGGSI